MRASARGCDVCGATQRTPLYRQRFAAFDDRSALDGYDVVACERCGFVYADAIPGQDFLDRYYREMSKYEAGAPGSTLSAAGLANHRAVVAEIAERRPDRRQRILDVGSADGHLLQCFREAGYEDVVGFDPSPACAASARERYGITVVNTPLSNMGFAGERFDLILLSSVLEHLRDLRPGVASLAALLADSGAIWIEVPDAERFVETAATPFQQFSLEHINFFTATTLALLLATAGAAPTHRWTTRRTLGPTFDPGVDLLFARRSARQGAVRDESGAAAVRAYVRASAAVEERLIASLAPLIERRTPVIVWGTGTLTLHLLGNERFRALDVVGFADSNVHYQGKTIAGRPVLAPADLATRDEPILIVSRAYEDEIARAIRERYALNNEIVRLFAAAHA